MIQGKKIFIQVRKNNIGAQQMCHNRRGISATIKFLHKYYKIRIYAGVTYRADTTEPN